MKHRSSRDLFDYWDKMRAGAPAPDRNDFTPEPVRHLLGDIFVLSYDASGGHPFRVAGTRLCALLGRDAKGESFSGLFSQQSRREIGDLIGIVAEEASPTVAGITAQDEQGNAIPLELLLLPFSTRAHTPISLTGSLVPFDEEHRLLKEFVLTSWRHIDSGEPFRSPRALRRREVIRGLMVYEGLR